MNKDEFAKLLLLSTQQAYDHAKSLDKKVLNSDKTKLVEEFKQLNNKLSDLNKEQRKRLQELNAYLYDGDGVA
jgi:hypothetical protein